jgi:hypothetical protein
MPIRRVGVPLGLAGLLLTGAAAAPGGPAAFAAGHQTGWRIVPSPNRARVGNNTLVQVSVGPATSAWAVGYDGQPGNFRTLAERWNGSKWALARSPNPSLLRLQSPRPSHAPRSGGGVREENAAALRRTGQPGSSGGVIAGEY